MTRRILALATVLAAVQPVWSQRPVRERHNFDNQWRFHKGDVNGAEAAAFDDAGWRPLRLPHDWSIEGPYSPDNASGTGYLPGGIGWYRKSFTLPDSAKGSKVFIEFDGVYRDADVWINGHHLGHRPYGYSSFEYDLTPHLNLTVNGNILAVRVDHKEVGDSRFYTGSGIYRHVWLTITQPVHVAHWGSFVHTPVAGAAEALVSAETTVVNESETAVGVKLVTTIQDSTGHEEAAMTVEGRIAKGAGYTFAQQGVVAKPKLWSIAEPNLYTAVTRVFTGGTLSDEYRTTFGIHDIRFDHDLGFFLNGKAEKLKGVCLHHDLGALGAAFSEAALERRLKALKSLGVNAIRCSHNPMSPELYSMCDRLGLVVMDEAFDEWTAGKNKWIKGWNAGTPGKAGYHEAFEEWSVRDIQDMVLRDRNHPSLILWSIGNEIDYPGDPFGHPKGRNGLRPGMLDANTLPLTARQLIAAVKGLDGTRPVTQALADTLASNATGLAELLDVTGYNYLQQHYAADHKMYPGRIILDSENGHSLDAWRAVAANPYVAGQFLWTGTDYLGESRAYPARGSTSGLLDLCGFRKAESYLREALWSDRPMVYAAAREARPQSGPQTDFETGARRGRLLEHWNWSGDSRKTIEIEVYTNGSSAELFLNEKSLGEKPVADALQPVLHWDVPNEPGVVRVIGRRGGAESARFELATTGAADHIEMVPDRGTLRADGADLSNIEIRVVDPVGRRVLGAVQTVDVQVSGAGALAAVDSGDIRDITPVQSGRRKVFEGRMLAIVRAGTAAGSIVVRASAGGLKPAEVPLTVR
jgi:hypothetical protein